MHFSGEVHSAPSLLRILPEQAEDLQLINVLDVRVQETPDLFRERIHRPSFLPLTATDSVAARQLRGGA